MGKKVLNPKESKTEKTGKVTGKTIVKVVCLNCNGSEITVSVNGVKSSNERHFQIMIQHSFIYKRDITCKNTES